MRRFLALFSLLAIALPAGITVTSCTRNPGANYCNGLGYGLKITDVASITLTPETTGISLGFGQTQQLSSPTAKTCKGTSASVSKYTYGSTNYNLVDISPSGNLCAGTWNRNTGGGIADYTICSVPSPTPSTNGLPYATAAVTASGDSVTSNAVTVFVHPLVTNAQLFTTPVGGASTGAQQCYSQTKTAQLNAQTCFTSNGAQQLLCAPAGLSASKYICPLPSGVTSVPDCSQVLGALSYTLGTGSIATVDADTNVITAAQPGTTTVTATVAGASSSAGYFSTCPPKSIAITLPNGSTTGTITQGVTQNLTTTVLDTNSNVITGLSLDYQTTDPLDLVVTSSGAISAPFAGAASISAICQPPSCNPAPINETGLFGTGLSISSNPVTVTVPGTASEQLWMSAPGASQYFTSVDLVLGTTNSNVRLPYVPNSMVMDQQGGSLYFGSSHELMIFATGSNSLAKGDTNAPGKVLAVSPNAEYLIINDPARQLFYLYGIASSTSSTYGGLGVAAAWTEDSKTAYIVDSAQAGAGHTDTLYVYNVNSGWTQYPLAASSGTNPGAMNVAVTVPGVGAFLTGNPTVSRTWCPAGIVGGRLTFYPQGDSVATLTQLLAATTDGKHMLGATVNSNAITVSDIALTIPQGSNSQCPGAGSSTLTALSTNAVLTGTLNLTQVNAPLTLDGLDASHNSNLAFFTYQYTGSAAPSSTAMLPYYIPQSSGVGASGVVTLLNGSKPSGVAPVAGAFSPDGTIYFVSTSGDNLIHEVNTKSLTDSTQFAPGLPACTPQSAGGTDPGCVVNSTGTVAPATAIVVKPRTTT